MRASTLQTAPRSLLYVPADKPRALQKARGLRPDALILDLEDAVAPEHKAAAREALRSALGDPFGVPVLVRVNGLGTEWEPGDRALVGELLGAGALAGVVLPKVEAARELEGWPAGLALWPMIETPLGVLRAPEIAAAPGVAGLLVGANDLARALDLPGHPQRLGLLHALGAVVLAARAHGRWALDAVYNDVRDPEGFAAECEQGRALGFHGKTLIHPAQLGPAHRAFGVSDEAAAQARELLSAWEEARRAGASVAVWRGALVEQMHADAAAERLARWTREREDEGAGAVPPEAGGSAG